METSHAEPRTSLAPSCTSSDSEAVPAAAPVATEAGRAKGIGESGYQSSSDIFEESRPLPKIQEVPGESEHDPPDRESSSSSSSREP